MRTGQSTHNVESDSTSSFRRLHNVNSLVLLTNAVQPSTRGKYDGHLKRWSTFLSLWGIPPTVEGLYLTHMNSTHPKSSLSIKEKVGILMGFVSYLSLDLGLKYSNVYAHLAGVRHHFRSANEMYDIFESPTLQSCKTGLRVLQQASKTVSPSNKRLPFTIDMVITMGTLVDTSKPSQVMTWTAVFTAYMCLFRKSEYIRDVASKTNHALLAEDVEFQLLNDSFVRAYEVTPSMFHLLKRVKLTLQSAKNDAWGSGSSMCYSVVVPADRLNIVHCLFKWCIMARFLSGSDPLFSLLDNGSRKCLQYKDILHAIHLTANRMGLDHTAFGTHSLRIGGASALRASGEDSAVIMRLGRWKSDTFLNYLRVSGSEFDRLTDVLTNPSAFTHSDVALLSRTRSKTQPPTRVTGKRPRIG